MEKKGIKIKEDAEWNRVQIVDVLMERESRGNVGVNG